MYLHYIKLITDFTCILPFRTDGEIDEAWVRDLRLSINIVNAW